MWNVEKMYECDSQMGENYVYMLHAGVAYTIHTHGGGSYYFLAEDQKKQTFFFPQL